MMILEKSNRPFFCICVILILVLVPILQTVPSNFVQPQTASGSGDPMVPAIGTITKSITFPFLTFKGQPDSSLTESIAWYQNGTTNILDSRGNSFSFTIPILSGVTFTLLQNSTTIDQKLVGPSLQYDIYWNAVQNKNGVVQKYKFSIVGSSVNGTTMQFPISSLENIVSDRNELWATHANSADFTSQNSNFTETGGIGINWADAIHQGYQVNFDSIHSILDFTVGKSYSIDPTVVATGIPTVSPSLSDYYEGEKRVVEIGGNIFAFYYNGSNIVYKSSSNSGSTWGASTLVGTGTGQLASDNQRWTIGSTTVSGNQYVSVVYWVVSGSNTLIKNIRGAVSGGTISWGTPSTLLSLPNNSPSLCSGSVCAAANEANDTNGNLFLTVRWLNSTASNYYNEEFKSTDGGNSFSTSDSPSNDGTGIRTEFVLARLASGDMLLVSAIYGGAPYPFTSEFSYSVYSSTNSTWHNPILTSGDGMSANSFKQFSADSNTTNAVYIAYNTGNGTGPLKVATWSSNGAFKTFETADSTLSHALPSITITRDNAIHVYTLVNGKVWQTDKVGSTWSAPVNPFGTTFNSPDQITSAILYPAAIWEENSATPYNLMFGVDSVPGTPAGLTATTISSSQINLSWTAPSDNGAAVTGYKIERSTNGGSTWSTIVSNTGSTGTTYSDTGLSSSTTYTYRVSAINSAGTGNPSTTESATTSSSSWHSSTGILEPLYLDPYDCTGCTPFHWQDIVGNATKYPHIPFFVIVNPGNDNFPNGGPGSPPNNPTAPCATEASYSGNRTADYDSGIASLTNAGVIVLGYVDTAFTQISEASVKGNVTVWQECYPGIKGIFLDEMSTTNGDQSYYSDITTYIHNKGLTYSFGNPGDESIPNFIGSVDKMVIYENYNHTDSCNNEYLLTNATLQGYDITQNCPYPVNYWHTQYDKSNFGFLQYGQSSISQRVVQGKSPYVSFMFITNDQSSDGNFWDTIPPYLDSLFSSINKTSVLSTIQAKNTTGNLLNATVLIYQDDNTNYLTRNAVTNFSSFNYNETSGWQFAFNAQPLSGYAIACWSDGVNSYSNPMVIAPTQSKTYTVTYKASGTCP